MKRLISFLLLFGLLAIPAHADKLRVGTPTSISFEFIPLDVGIEKGIYKKYNLDIERIDIAGGSKLHQTMMAGSLDVISAGGTGIMFYMRGAPGRAVAATSNSMNSVSFVVRADDPAKTVQDLKGRAMGITTAGSFTHWFARAISMKYGWGPDGFKLVPLGGMGSVTSALMSKNVDVMVGATAEAFMLEDENRARIIMMGGSEIQDYIFNMIFASERIMENDPEKLRRFLAAWFETVAYIKANKGETVRIASNVMRLPESVISRVYDAYGSAFFTNGHFDRKMLEAVKQSLIDVDIIQTAPPDDKIISEKFLP